MKHGIRRYIGPKRIILMMLVFLAIGYLWRSYQLGELSPELITQYAHVHPLRAISLYFLLYIISVVAFLPTLPLNLAGGYFWGGLVGGIFAALSVTLGGLCAFSSARWLFGQPLSGRFGGEMAQKIEEEFDKSGWKFIAFARINPIFPTGPLNYLLGLTSVSSLTFTWTTFFFSFLHQLAWHTSAM